MEETSSEICKPERVATSCIWRIQRWAALTILLLTIGFLLMMMFEGETMTVTGMTVRHISD